MERMGLLLAYNDPHKTTTYTDCVNNLRVLVEGFFSKRCKSLHQIAACELAFLALCCTCSLQMYQFPLGHGRQKRTYDNRTHTVINPLRFPAVAIRCTVRQVNVGEYGPGEALHVDVDLITVHTFVRFWVCSSTQMTLQACHRRYEKELTFALCTRQFLLRRCRLRIEVGGRRAFERLH
jgi:hypothetical protein